MYAKVALMVASKLMQDQNELPSHSSTPSCLINPSQASQPMLKKRSSQMGRGPSVNTGMAVRPLALDSWQINSDAPFSAFTVPISPRPTKARKTANGYLPIQIPDYPTEVREYDPAEYIRDSRATLSPAFPSSIRSRRSSNQPRSPASSLSQSPGTVSDGFTNATTLFSADMQRQDSLGGSSFYGGLNMLKLDSQRSEVVPHCDSRGDNSPALNHPLSFTSTPISDVPAIDFSLSVSHAGGMVDDTFPLSESFITENVDLPWGLEDEICMTRTDSSGSSSSSKSRIARRSEEQVALSARPLAPKDSAESISRAIPSSSSSEHHMIRQLSADGSKVAIQKAKYTRPPHEKVYCTRCNIKPEGFRGPHELRRHVENRHGATRKMWVCRDASPDQKFLSECKSCREQKTYGAYYNAGAHLRRIHFNPRAKGKKSDKPVKARGGDGGGDYPPMDVLRLWMEEIDVPVKKTMPPSDDTENDDEANLDADSFQDEYDIQTFHPIDDPRNFTTPSVDSASSSNVEIEHSGYALPASDGMPVQPEFSSPEYCSRFDFAAHGEIRHNFDFPPTFSTTMSDLYHPSPTKDISSSAPVAAQLNTNAMDSLLVNQSLATNNVVSTKLSLISSMNSPADPVDLSEHDFFDYS